MRRRPGGARSRRFRARADGSDREIDGALDSLGADQLREFIRYALESLDYARRLEVTDLLIALAARGSAWKPSAPPRRTLDEARRFAEAAGEMGYADPDRVDGYLRQAVRASLARDPQTARALFEIVLSLLASGEVHLGQDETVDEVLSSDLHDCSARYFLSVYLTTRMEDRPEALRRAIDSVADLGWFPEPIGDMERVASEPLPDVSRFLPAWLGLLEGRAAEQDGWHSAGDRQLREAVLRVEGVGGLERLARATGQPEALKAWCEALAAAEDGPAALRAYDAAARLTRESYWRGEFLDGAAREAWKLGRKDAARRLEAAWQSAPSLRRLLRWLGAGKVGAAVLNRRARKALTRCPKTAAAQLGLLHILAGEPSSAALVLAKAPGLGWSGEDHPGHLLFPILANLLDTDGGETAASSISSGLARERGRNWDSTWEDDEDAGSEPPTPSVAEVLEVARGEMRLNSPVRKELFGALLAAARKRVEGIVGHKRRRHYDHAATLLACCMELAPGVERSPATKRSVEALRRKFSRHYAFQKELDLALGAISP